MNENYIFVDQLINLKILECVGYIQDKSLSLIFLAPVFLSPIKHMTKNFTLHSRTSRCWESVNHSSNWWRRRQEMETSESWRVSQRKTILDKPQE